MPSVLAAVRPSHFADPVGGTFDQINWIANDGTLEVTRYEYGYDQRGNRTFIDVSDHIADQDWLFQYDGLSRLVTATRGAFDGSGNFLASPVPEATTWNLEGVGNWSGDTTSSQSVIRFGDLDLDGLFDVGETFVDGSHHVVGADNEIDTHITLDSNQTATSQPFFYDDAGNLVFDGQRFYVYDAFNRLTVIHDPGTLYVDTTQTPHVLAGAAGAALVRFEYDALGRRVLTIETPTGTPTTTRHAYGTGAGVLAEYDVASGGTETLQRWFIHGQSFPDPLVLVDLTGAGGGTAGTAQYFYYLKDALGSVGSLTDSAGAEVELYTYTPYGQTTIYTSAGTPLTASAYGNPFAWTGQRYDADNELYLFIFRTYSIALGRFMERDPLGSVATQGELDLGAYGTIPGLFSLSLAPAGEYADGLNLTQYVHSNPVNWTDPDGRFSFIDLTGATGLGLDLDANNFDTGMSLAGAMQGLADLFSQRNMMLEEFASSAASSPDLSGLDTALTVYAAYQTVQMARFGTGLLKAGFSFAKSGTSKLLKMLRRGFGRGGRSFSSFSALKRALGPAGSGKAWHHVVEQSKEKLFGPKLIQNTDNVVAVPSRINADLNALYSSKRPDITGSNLTIRKWLESKPFEYNREFGLRALRNVEQGIWP